MTNQIKEIIAIPIGLKPVIKFNNEILYGSDNLNKKFIKALSKVPRTKSLSKQLEILVNNKKIIPCFFSKSFTDFVAWKIFKSKPITIQTYEYEYDEGNKIKGSEKKISIKIDPTKVAHSIVGFYTLEYKKVIIMMSNNLNIFTYAPNNFLSELTLHELIHMVALQKPSEFLAVFKKDLLLYYTNLWTQIFKLQKEKIKESDIQNILNFILKLERQTAKINSGDLIKYYKLLENLKKYSVLKDKDFIKQLIDYIVIIKIYLKNMSLFFGKIDAYSNIIIPMYVTYKEVFGIKDLTTQCIQELIYPSEIIAIYSEKGTSPKFKTIVSNL